MLEMDNAVRVQVGVEAAFVDAELPDSSAYADPPRAKLSVHAG
jgi:hypothetical protein